MSKTQRRWSPQEDSILRKEADAQISANNGAVQDWNSIAQKIHGRSNKDCRKRFYNGLTQGLKKGQWTTEEDQCLERLVGEHGPAWAIIGQQRNRLRGYIECSKRWHHCLNPDLDRSPWSTKENVELLMAVRTHGSAWKNIQVLHLPHRAANNIKNQFRHTLLKRQSLEVPPETPPCCSVQLPERSHASQKETKTSSPSNESAIFLEDPNGDMGRTMDILTDKEYGNDMFDESFPYPTLEDDDPFQLLGTKAQSHDMPFENTSCNVNVLDAPRNPNVDPMALDFNHQAFDFQMQDVISDALACTETQPRTSGNQPSDPTADSSEDSHRISDSSSNPRESLAVYNPEQLQHHQRNHSCNSVSATSSSSHAGPNVKTTIRFESVDQSTMSAIVWVLMESKARFVFETN